MSDQIKYYAELLCYCSVSASALYLVYNTVWESEDPVGKSYRDAAFLTEGKENMKRSVMKNTIMCWLEKPNSSIRLKLNELISENSRLFVKQNSEQ